MSPLSRRIWSARDAVTTLTRCCSAIPRTLGILPPSHRPSCICFSRATATSTYFGVGSVLDVGMGESPPRWVVLPPPGSVYYRDTRLHGFRGSPHLVPRSWLPCCRSGCARHPPEVGHSPT